MAIRNGDRQILKQKKDLVDEDLVDETESAYETDSVDMSNETFEEDFIDNEKNSLDDLKLTEKKVINIDIDEKSEQSQSDVDFYDGNIDSFEIDDILKKLDLIESKIDEKLNLENEKKEYLEVTEMVQELLNKQRHFENQLSSTLRQNAEFQQQVRINMLKELETYQKELLGERMNPILKSIASLYVEYKDVFSEIEDKKIRNNLDSLFEDISEILKEYGCTITSSNIGEKRSARLSKIRNVILTSDEKLHNTVAVSYNESISRGQKVLYPEYIDTYKYDETLIEEETEIENPLEDEKYSQNESISDNKSEKENIELSESE